MNDVTLLPVPSSVSDVFLPLRLQLASPSESQRTVRICLKGNVDRLRGGAGQHDRSDR
jgi:hypothetical protein